MAPKPATKVKYVTFFDAVRRKFGSEAEKPAAVKRPVVCVVTPSFNADAYIDDTISSVVTQAGDFSVRYHVQDGGSTDGTLKKLAAWQERLADSSFCSMCAGVEFTYASGWDKGMYSALNAGFAAAAAPSSDFMTWINADDRIVQGAFQTVARVFADYPDAAFLSGRISLLNEQGSIIGTMEPRAFSRRALQAGLHEGRYIGFLMQEGTFWRSSLWSAIGELREDLRLAGDFDLWRRFAEHGPMLAVNSALGLHRIHPSQMSSDKGVYSAEVDTIVDHGLREQAWSEYQAALSSSEKFHAAGFAGEILNYNLNLGMWQKADDVSAVKTFAPSAPQPPIHVSAAGVHHMIEATYLHGFREPEGPYPELGLHTRVRWTVEPKVVLIFDAPVAGRYEISIQSRVCFGGLKATVTSMGQALVSCDLPYTGHERNCIIEAKAEFAAGSNEIGIEFSFAEGQQSSGLYLLILACHATLVPS